MNVIGKSISIDRQTSDSPVEKPGAENPLVTPDSVKKPASHSNAQSLLLWFSGLQLQSFFIGTLSLTVGTWPPNTTLITLLILKMCPRH